MRAENVLFVPSTMTVPYLSRVERAYSKPILNLGPPPRTIARPTGSTTRRKLSGNGLYSTVSSPSRLTCPAFPNISLPALPNTSSIYHSFDIGRGICYTSVGRTESLVNQSGANLEIEETIGANLEHIPQSLTETLGSTEHNFLRHVFNTINEKTYPTVSASLLQEPLQVTSVLNQLPKEIGEFIARIRQGDIRTAVIEGEKDGIFLGPDPWKAMPQALFSAIVRCFDPFEISPSIDPGHGTPIPPAIHQYCNLNGMVLPSGDRQAHVTMFVFLRWLLTIRIASGLMPCASDWRVLMRLAGASSNRDSVRRLWSASVLVRRSHAGDLRHAEDFTEMIKARYLSHPLYRNFHVFKSRVSIFEIGRKTSLKIPRVRRRLLAQLRLNHAANVVRMDETQQLKGVLGIDEATTAFASEWFHDLIDRIVGRGVVASEDLLCSIIAAFGRQGDLRAARNIFLNIWGIAIKTDHDSPNVRVTGGHDFPDDISLKPTSRLVETAILVFGSNSEMQTMFKLVDFISSRYGIPLRHEDWTEILSWTYLNSTSRVRREWQLAGFPQKIVSMDAVELVWKTMIDNPYNITPTFNDYDMYIKFLIRSRRLTDAIRYLYHVKDKLYSPLVQELHLAEKVYLAALASNLKVDDAALRYERLLLQQNVRKASITSWVNGICKKARPLEDADPFVTRLLPKIFLTLEEFQPFPISYKTFNGSVTIRNPHARRHIQILKSGSHLHEATREILRWKIPVNFTSKKWLLDLLGFKARYLGSDYQGSPLGFYLTSSSTGSLGRGVVRKGNISSISNEDNSSLTIPSWRNVRIYFDYPLQRKKSTRRLNRPIFGIKARTIDIARRVGLQIGHRDLLMRFQDDGLTERGGRRVPDYRALQNNTEQTDFARVMKDIVDRAQKEIRKEEYKTRKENNPRDLVPDSNNKQVSKTERTSASLKAWKTTKFLFPKALHPGIRDEEGWKWALERHKWPNAEGAAAERLQQAELVDIIVGRRRLGPRKLKRRGLKIIGTNNMEALRPTDCNHFARQRKREDSKDKFTQQWREQESLESSGLAG